MRRFFPPTPRELKEEVERKSKMTKKLITICLIAMLLSAAATRTHAYSTIGPGGFSSSAVTIDFEGYSVGTAITTQYVGVVFSSYNGTGNPLIDTNESGGGQGLNGGLKGDMYVKFRMVIPKEKDFTEEQKGLLVDLFA